MILILYILIHIHIYILILKYLIKLNTYFSVTAGDVYITHIHLFMDSLFYGTSYGYGI